MVGTLTQTQKRDRVWHALSRSINTCLIKDQAGAAEKAEIDGLSSKATRIVDKVRGKVKRDPPL